MNVASARPAVARQINLQGLSDTVEIDYDLWGIPHIYAHSMDDLFFGNGYAHAADRLWQMDAARRRALGRFAAWAGKEALSSTCSCAASILRRFPARITRHFPRNAAHVRTLCPGCECLDRLGTIARRIPAPGRKARALGRLALRAGHAPARHPHGIALVQTVARHSICPYRTGLPAPAALRGWRHREVRRAAGTERGSLEHFAGRTSPRH